MAVKRFQECNRIVQLWRYRHYITIPFKYLYYTYIKRFKVYHDEMVDGKLIHTNEYDIEQGRNLWRLLQSLAQTKMHWYYTEEEMFIKLDTLDDKLKDKE